jgi:hypothetical protein
MGAMRNAYTKPGGKTPFEKPRHRWEDNIEVDLGKIWWIWIGFIWLRMGIGDGLL